LIRRYFDYNASAPAVEGVAEVCQALVGGGALNPSSVHAEGRRARAMLERARRQVAAAVKVDPNDIRFTSGATEAIYDFIYGFLNQGDHVVASPYEHPAVYGALRQVDATVSLCEVSRGGLLSVEEVLRQIKPETKLVVVMFAQNELGSLLPVQEIVKAVAPIPVFVDAVQAFGKLPLDFSSLGIAGASLSGHKIGGLSGCGALWHDPNIVLRSRTTGGAQEGGARGGTENLMGAVTMGHAASQLKGRLDASDRLRGYQGYLERALLTVQGVEILGTSCFRLCNTTLFRAGGVPGDLIVQWMDMDGFSLSTGSACSSGSIEPSSTLIAMGMSEVEAREGVRISTGPETSMGDVELLAQSLVNRLNEFIRRQRSDG
jgi:cysteine desulfurase